jgi:exodeoxyribonuclease-5
MITLTKGQQDGLEKLEAFLADPSANFFLLTGSAGCGKTTLTNNILPLVTDGDVVACAPTHKACSVIQSNLPTTKCLTIHKFLGLKPKKSGTTTGLAKQRNYDPTEWMGFTVVLLDEVSMVGHDLAKFIKDDALSWNRKYIFIGDRYQLPPVDEKYSPIYDWEIPECYRHELTEIVRQAEDNPIIRAATAIRDCIVGGKEPPLRQYKADNNTGIYLLKPAEWEAKLNEYVHLPEYKANSDFMRIIAYRNATVHSYNQKVRELLGEDLTYPFSIGDKVVANEAWVVQDEVLMSTGQEFTIELIYPHTHPVYPTIQGFFLELEELPGYPVYVLDYAQSSGAYKSALQEAAIIGTKQGDWQPYYGLQEYFADLRPVYALTSHKSQGSTFDNVMVDFRDIYTNRKMSEADRCYYVATTRARYNVYLLA